MENESGIEDVFPIEHRDVQASHVTFTRSVVFGDVLLQEIPSPRPRLCSKVDELSNATGTDTVDLGDMGTVYREGGG